MDPGGASRVHTEVTGVRSDGHYVGVQTVGDHVRDLVLDIDGSLVSGATDMGPATLHMERVWVAGRQMPPRSCAGPDSPISKLRLRSVPTSHSVWWVAALGSPASVTMLHRCRSSSRPSHWSRRPCSARPRRSTAPGTTWGDQWVPMGTISNRLPWSLRRNWCGGVTNSPMRLLLSLPTGFRSASLDGFIEAIWPECLF